MLQLRNMALKDSHLGYRVALQGSMPLFESNSIQKREQLQRMSRGREAPLSPFWSMIQLSMLVRGTSVSSETILQVCLSR